MPTKLRHRLFFLSLLVLFTAHQAHAQQESYLLTGTVLDDAGEPAYGATVVVPGPQLVGVAVDEDGYFQLVLKEKIDSVVVRWLGDKQVVDGLHDQWRGPGSTVNIEVKIGYTQEPLPPVKIYAYVPQMDDIQSFELRRGDQSAIELGMNLTPGVRFESRGPGGSRRLALRGGFLRGPFGVREVRVYMLGAALSSPDGATPLELLDMATIGSIALHKGPSSAEFGPASDGVVTVNVQDPSPYRRRGGLVSQMLGSYGYSRTVAQVALENKLALTYVRQRHAGYRAQEANRMDRLELLLMRTRRDATVRAHLLLYDGAWELPGALDSLTAAESPRSAAALSDSLDAHVARRHARLTLSGYFLRKKWIGKGTIYLHLADKENPFATNPTRTGYKVEASQGMGGRFSLMYDRKRHRFQVGVEYQGEWLNFKQYENLAGIAGGLTMRYRTFSEVILGTAEYRYQLSHHALWAQASLSHVGYLQRDAWSSLEPVVGGRTGFGLTPAATVMFHVNEHETRRRSCFFKAATGYSPPSIAEATDSVGRLHADLRSENGLNLEWRGVTRDKKERFRGEANVYQHWTWGAIVPVVTGTGGLYYANAGSTTQQGLEAAARYQIPLKIAERWHYLFLEGRAELQRLTFGDYVLSGNDLRGKQVPGVAPFTLTAMADYAFPRLVYIRMTGQWVGPSYLNSLNTVSQPGHLLLNAQIQVFPPLNRLLKRLGGPVIVFEESHHLFLTGGVNNLLNTRYTSFPQLNAFGGRYYNPAPGINGYGGIEFKF